LRRGPVTRSVFQTTLDRAHGIVSGSAGVPATGRVYTRRLNRKVQILIFNVSFPRCSQQKEGEENREGVGATSGCQRMPLNRIATVLILTRGVRSAIGLALVVFANTAGTACRTLRHSQTSDHPPLPGTPTAKTAGQKTRKLLKGVAGTTGFEPAERGGKQ
jgi:hypothetical protein